MPHSPRLLERESELDTLVDARDASGYLASSRRRSLVRRFLGPSQRTRDKTRREVPAVCRDMPKMYCVHSRILASPKFSSRVSARQSRRMCTAGIRIKCHVVLKVKDDIFYIETLIYPNYFLCLRFWFK